MTAKWVPNHRKIGRSVDRARQRAHVADLPEDVLHEVDDVAQQVAERLAPARSRMNRQ